MDREPAVIIGAVMGVIEGVVALLVALGVIELGVSEGIVVAAGAVLALGQALWTRSKVWSPASHYQAVTDAIAYERLPGGQE